MASPTLRLLDTHVSLEITMAMMAAVFPILPGKTGDWHKFIAELNGPRKADFDASRAKAHVREQTYLQETPMGDLVIVTLQGEGPGHAFGQMMAADDAFTTWFVKEAGAIHGMDLRAPLAGPPSTQVLDTGEAARPR
jgi:hypothetical protein